MNSPEPIAPNRKFGAMGHPSRGVEEYGSLSFTREGTLPAA
jgi:hypothetical protein